MAKRYLIDTSAIIKYLNQTFSTTAISFIDEILDTESNISFISEIELQSWNPTNKDDLLIYQQYINSSSIFLIEKNIILKTIEIRRTSRIKIADAIIAATAIINNLTLIGDNDKDFLKVSGLQYTNPNRV